MKNIKYVSDYKEYKSNEYWAYAYQTLRHKKGDCEDGAILLANILLHNGVPFWRVRINAGWVKEPKGGQVGHAYVTYCRETDNQWIVLDWCYYTKYASVKERALHSELKDYYSLWFSFDKSQAYGNKKYMKGMADVFKEE